MNKTIQYNVLLMLQHAYIACEYLVEVVYTIFHIINLSSRKPKVLKGIKKLSSGKMLDYDHQWFFFIVKHMFICSKRSLNWSVETAFSIGCEPNANVWYWMWDLIKRVVIEINEIVFYCRELHQGVRERSTWPKGCPFCPIDQRMKIVYFRR